MRLRAWGALVLACLLAGAGAAPAAAAPGCTQSPPGVQVDNTWAWSGWGSYGLAGQQLRYSIAVRNYDLGCSASTFVVRLSVPAGFAVVMSATTITLKSYATGYLSALVTSPAGSSDGDYPLMATVQRAGDSTMGTPFTSTYKVYSSDTTPPTLFWPNPGHGTTISGRSYNVVVSASDDRAVQRIELSIDGAHRSTTTCDGIDYTCQLVYAWSLRGAKGQHSATFTAYDFKGNTASMTVSFGVS